MLAVSVAGFSPAAQAEEKPANNIKTAISSTTISGYVSTSANWLLQGGDSSQTRLPGRSFVGQNKMDGINLDAANLVIEKPFDESLWSAGYKIDLMLGPDADALGTSVLGSADLNQSDFAVKQAYVSAITPVGNGLNFKMGVFDTIIGYEVVHSGDNPHYTRSYGFFLEPFQHTGLLANYQFNEVLGMSMGVADSQSSVINQRADEEENITYLGALYFTAPEGMGVLSDSQASVGTTYGGFDTVGNERLNFYAGGTIMTPIEGLNLGAAYDYVQRNNNTFSGATAADGSAKTIAGYLTWDATQKLDLNFRADYAESDDGFFDLRNRRRGTIGAPVYNEELFALTLTADYSLWPNVITRTELRYDQDLEDQAGGAFGTVNTPNEEAFMLGLNLIYQF